MWAVFDVTFTVSFIWFTRNLQAPLLCLHYWYLQAPLFDLHHIYRPPYSIYMVLRVSHTRFTWYLQVPLFDLHDLQASLFDLHDWYLQGPLFDLHVNFPAPLFDLYDICELLYSVYMIFTGSFIQLIHMIFTSSFIRFTS